MICPPQLCNDSAINAAICRGEKWSVQSDGGTMKRETAPAPLTLSMSVTFHSGWMVQEESQGKLAWTTAGEHFNTWSHERTHLSLMKVTRTTCSKQTSMCQILMLINIYIKYFRLHFLIILKVSVFDVVCIQSQISPAHALSMDFTTNTQQSTSLDTKEWNTHVVVWRTWCCLLPSWAWT